MIDINHEELIALRDVPRRLPKRSNGKKLHISAVYRWTQRGVHGVRLETVKLGGTTYTSAEALQRFADRQSDRNEQPAPAIMPTLTRQRQIDRATRDVQKILGHRRRTTSNNKP